MPRLAVCTEASVCMDAVKLEEVAVKSEFFIWEGIELRKGRMRAAKGGSTNRSTKGWG